MWIAGGSFGVMGWLAKEVDGVGDLREGRKGILVMWAMERGAE